MGSQRLYPGVGREKEASAAILDFPSSTLPWRSRNLILSSCTLWNPSQHDLPLLEADPGVVISSLCCW